jgi:V/A-type H+-transporting ATPase subunit C
VVDSLLSEVMKNSAIATKVRARSADFLTDEQLEHILTLKTVHEIITYLKTETPYSKILSGAQEDLHRGGLEIILRNSLFEDAASLKLFDNGEAKNFLKLVLMRGEIEAIKFRIRLIFNDRDEYSEILRRNTDAKIKNYTKLGFLTSEENPREMTFETFVEQTKGSPYYKVLHPFLVNKELRNVFSVETALDTFHVKRCFLALKRIRNKEDKKVLEELYGLEADIENIMFVLRAKFYYNLHSDKIYPYVLPRYYKIRPETIKSLVEAPSLNDAIELLNKTAYRKAFIKDANFLEESLHWFMAESFRKMFKTHAFSSAVPVIYLRLKNIEIEKIMVIVEGVRYGMKPDEIEKYMEGDRALDRDVA